jgi:hypothetical protein
MIDEGIKALTDEATASDAWLRLLPSLAIDQTVGIKVNTINCTYLPSHPEVAIPIAESLADVTIGSVDFPINQAVIWDRWEWELVAAGYTMNYGTTGYRCIATNNSAIGYNPEQIAIPGYPNSPQRVSRCYTDYSDHLVNLCLLKNHVFSGVTHSLKNHYGTVDDPGGIHGGYCNPGIPGVYSELINNYGQRQRLCICDAIYGIRSGGPMGPPQFIYNGIVLSDDPVALDTICMGILEDNGCTTGYMATHIETASNPPYNLGNHDLADIEVIYIENPSGIADSGKSVLPGKIALERNYPEPFNARTTIPVELYRQANIHFEVHNIKGRRIATLYKGILPAGRHDFVWNGRSAGGQDASSGRYFVRMVTDNRTYSRGITLIR